MKSYTQTCISRSSLAACLVLLPALLCPEKQPPSLPALSLPPPLCLPFMVFKLQLLPRANSEDLQQA